MPPTADQLATMTDLDLNRMVEQTVYREEPLLTRDYCDDPAAMMHLIEKVRTTGSSCSIFINAIEFQVHICIPGRAGESAYAGGTSLPRAVAIAAVLAAGGGR